MKLYIRFLPLIAFIIMLNQSLHAMGELRGGGLMVAPTRLVFEGKNRTAELTLTNNGNETSTYRIQTLNSLMDEFGKRTSIISPADDNESFADKYVRFAPRQIRLKPGEQQTVRVMLRLPNNISDGEYRTGLNFQWIPEPGEPDIRKGQVERGEVAVQIQFSYGITVPVIIRKGNLEASGKIVETVINKTEKGRQLLVKIARTGNRSLYGDFSVFHIDTDGKENLVSTMGGVAIYVPNPHRIFSVDLPEDLPFGKGNGKTMLRVEYRERKEVGKKLIAETVIPAE